MVLSILSPRTAMAQPLLCSKNKKYTFASHQNKDFFMELKAYSTKWEHSEPPTSRLNTLFSQKRKYFTGRKSLVNRENPLTRSVGALWSNLQVWWNILFSVQKCILDMRWGLRVSPLSRVGFQLDKTVFVLASSESVIDFDYRRKRDGKE